MVQAIAVLYQCPVAPAGPQLLLPRDQKILVSTQKLSTTDHGFHKFRALQGSSQFFLEHSCGDVCMLFACLQDKK